MTNNKKYIGENKFLETQKEDDISFSELWKSVLRKKKWAYASSIIIFTGTLIYTINQRIFNPTYKGTFAVLIKNPFDTQMEKGGEGLKNVGLSFGAGLSSNSLTKIEINTLIRLLKSPGFVEPVAINHDIKPINLSKSITITQPGYNWSNLEDVLLVKVTLKDRVQGQKVLTSLSNLFLEESLKRKRQKLNDGLNFLKKEEPIIKSRENKLQSELEAFREKNNLIDPIGEAKILKEQKILIEKNIMNLESNNKLLNDVKEEIKNGSLSARGFQEKFGDGLIVSDFNPNLLSQLITVEEELAVAKTKYTPESSIIKGLQSRLNQIQPLLLKNQLEAVETAINLNQGRIKNDINQAKKLESQFNKLPVLIKEYSRIYQKLEFANQNLINLNATIADYQLRIAQSTVPWRIIAEPEIDPVPIKPSFVKNLSYGLVISTFFGLLIALIRDRFDYVYHSAEEIAESCKTIVIGYFPFIKNFESLRGEKKASTEFIKFLKNDENSNVFNKSSYQKFFFTEALRNIYTSINLLKTENQLKSLLITSSVPKEGKTLFNILLSKTVAEMGQRVLLIDADMRKPSIDTRLGINNFLGLSNILSDNTMALDEVIQKESLIRNLDIITSGPVPPDPTRLLNSEVFKKFIDELYSLKKYDFILFDAPPVLGLADSLLISKCVSGVILIVGLERTNRSFPNESLNSLKTSTSNILGVVANGTKESVGNSGRYYGTYETYANYSEELNNEQKSPSESLHEKNISKFILNKTKNLYLKISKFLTKFLDN